MSTPHVLRLQEGQDLKKEIIQFASVNSIHSAYIGTCVGSLKQLHIRLATAENYIKTSFKDVPLKTFEITSLVGTLSEDGVHFHLTVSDSQGNCLGGHLMEDCIVFSTAEIVLISLTNVNLSRVFDAKTGYKELVVNPRQDKQDTSELSKQSSVQYSLTSSGQILLGILGIGIIAGLFYCKRKSFVLVTNT